MKILTVDDDPLFLDVVRVILSAGGFDDVTSAQSAQEAAQIVTNAAKPFDCVFIDLQMPEIQGDYLCRWLRGQPDYRDRSIVMLTASGRKEDVQRSFIARASDYLTKPIDATELITRLRQIASAASGTGAGSGGMADPAQSGSGAPQSYFDAALIEGIKRSVGLDALANYVGQLSLSDENRLSTVVFRLREGAAVHRRCSEEEFGALLAILAQTILDNTGFSNPLIAYAGSGNFMLVSDAATQRPEERAETEAAINADLDRQALALDDGTPLDLRIEMLPLARLGGRTPQQKVTALFRALEEAEQQTLSMRLGLLDP